MAFYNRYRFYCSKECIQEGRHNLKTKNNKRFSNLVDSSTYALKTLLNLPANQIPASLRVAMFKVFKTRKEIQCRMK